MFNFFPKFLYAFLLFLLFVVGISIAVDVGTMFLVESRGQYIARNANIYVSKFAVSEDKLSQFEKGNITEDEVKDVLQEYFIRQYGGFNFEFNPTASSRGAGNLKLVFEPNNAINSRSDGEYSGYGPVTVRALFKDFNSGSGGTVAFQIEQKMPFTIRGFLESQYDAGFTEYARLIDSDGKFGYYYVETERAFKINTLDKSFSNS